MLAVKFHMIGRSLRQSYLGSRTGLILARVLSGEKVFCNPNIIAIMAYDLGYADLSVTRSTVIPPPSIDTLVFVIRRLRMRLSTGTGPCPQRPQEKNIHVRLIGHAFPETN